mmetsp:Transcript_7406/g.10677  ORF Transcript_7406/g.10677 Transcript_7406/m.10677 type:complete len:273 (-) Transcript_7406:284-1102(-)
MTQQVSTANTVLFCALSFLCVDIVADWDGYQRCPKPIHKWLLSSYALLALLLLVGLAAAKLSSTEAGHFLLNARPKGAAMKFMFSCTWLVLVPLFTAWSALGTAWAYEVQTRAPSCLPSSMHLTFLVVWQVVSYAWIVFYGGMGFMSWMAERKVRQAEQDLRDLEDPDIVERWGPVGTLEGYTSLPAKMASSGLTPGQIKQLPGVSKFCCSPTNCEQDCPICLNSLAEGETVRELCGCCHVFHRSCIDLWLLRSSDCPLCKQTVGVPDTTDM